MTHLLKVIFVIITISFLFACSDTTSTEDTAADATTTTPEATNTSEKSVQFLTRGERYDEVLKDTFNSIIIDEAVSKSLSDAERAAIGYVATFIGSECDWDGNPNKDRSNLKCEVISALNLGYQCSDTHLGFLKGWFKEDAEVLKKLENCATVPFTATSQNTFDTIDLTTKGNTITVAIAANGINMRMAESWSWTEENIFEVTNDKLKLVKTNKSEVVREKIDMGM